MCDASDFAVGAVLGQRVDKKLNVIHYASKTHRVGIFTWIKMLKRLVLSRIYKKEVIFPLRIKDKVQSVIFTVAWGW
jgi:hypothetical protein